MDIIEMTRELGKKLQAEESYIAMRSAQQICDDDESLQQLIGEFNLKHMAINNEAQKDDRNEDTLKRLNEEFRGIYAQIMANENMSRYNSAKTEFDATLQRVTAIIGLCADGENPDTCDYEAACSGDCSTCGGCH
ncbi:YlbF family regulator [uncultured Neglectibacter sp.]|uniref:YlbF family regulator n=1 Tax=uncultured Neglectibacter sp. TaxID=1924108 RepID=UPI0034E037B4